MLSLTGNSWAGVLAPVENWAIPWAWHLVAVASPEHLRVAIGSDEKTKEVPGSPSKERGAGLTMMS